jgi:hypothetical protein
MRLLAGATILKYPGIRPGWRLFIICLARESGIGVNNGGSGLSTRYIGLSMAKLIALTALLLAAASGGALSQDNSTASENETSNATAVAITAVEAPPSAPEPLKASEPAEPANVKGLWNVSLAGVQITLALNQSEDSLFGRAKFEGAHPWNGVIAGSISGRQVYIALAAMQGKVLVSTELIGTADGDIIQGSYVRSDSQSRAAKGDMKAERFNLETEVYTPATEEATPQPAPAEFPPKVEPAVQSTSTRGSFKDVRDLAKGINPNIMPSSVAL